MHYGIRKARQLLKLFSLVALACLTSLVVIACTNQGSDTATTGTTEIVIATEDDYPPFDFLQDGKHVGYNQDLLDAIAEGSPYTIKQEVLPWQGILTGIAAGKYSGSNAAVTILEERVSAVDFTMPTTELTNHYLKRKGDTSINGIEDFSGKNVGVQQGGVTASLLTGTVNKQLEEAGKPPATPVEYGAFAEAYTDLENGRLDVVINNIVALSQLMKAKGDVFEVGPQVGDKMYAAWAVQKGNTEVLTFLNDGLAELKANGTMQELQEKWLNISFELPDEPLLPGDKPLE